MSAFNRQESCPVHGGWRRRCYGDRLGICNLTTSILQEWGWGGALAGRGQGVCWLFPSCVSGSHLPPQARPRCRPSAGRTWGCSVLGRLWCTAACGSHSFTHTSSGAAACSHGLSPPRGHEDCPPAMATALGGPRHPHPRLQFWSEAGARV